MSNEKLLFIGHKTLIYSRRRFILFGPRTIKEYVDLGEYRPYTGTAVVPGTLRGKLTDEPPVYENASLAGSRPRAQNISEAKGRA